MIAILGAGISGLTLAYELEKKGVEYSLLEKSDRPGGALYSIEHEGVVMERGANSLFFSEPVRNLVASLELENEVLFAEEVSSKRFVLKNNQVKPLPTKPQELLISNYFNLRTKFAIAKEMVMKPEEVTEESVAGFFRRHFNQEVVDYAVQPFISGIYAGDAEKIKVELAFPKLAELAQQYGSVLKGFAKDKPERRKVISFKKGNQQLANTLAEKLNYLHYNTPVSGIRREGGIYNIIAGDRILEADTIVSTLPAHAIAPLIEDFAPEAALAFSKIEYVPIWMVHLVLDSKKVEAKFNGFGCLYPKVENKSTLGMIWNSSIFPSKAPEGQFLTSVLLGGAFKPALAQRSKEEILGIALQEMEEIYDIKDSAVHYMDAYLWKEGIPQYDHQLYRAYKSADELEKLEFLIHANWHKGISVPDCIEKSVRLSQILSKQQPIAE